VGFCPDQRRLPAVRSYRGLWLWFGGLFLALFLFLAAVAIAYFAKQEHYSLFLNGWMLGALICFLAGFSCLFGSVAGWPFPPLVRPEFPNVEVDIYGTGSLDTQRESESGLAVTVRLRSYHVRFKNAGSGQPASLTVQLYVRLDPGSWGRVGEALCPVPDWALPPSLGLSPIEMPFELPPGDVLAGHLVFEIPGYYLGKLAEPMSARLELWDHLTDKRMTLPAEIGSHDRNSMAPSAGGAEVLGPEFEGQADESPASDSQAGQPGDARQASA
jgi:hypothetical protein